MRHTYGRVRAAPHNAHFVLLRMGFTRQLRLRSPGELLPHHFNLATALPVSAECFCCTFPTVTCGGRYPSSLPCGARTFLIRISARDRLVYPLNPYLCNYNQNLNYFNIVISEISEVLIFWLFCSEICIFPSGDKFSKSFSPHF